MVVLTPLQGFQMFIIESCCVRSVQAQSQLDGLGGAFRCRPLRNPVPAPMLLSRFSPPRKTL